MGSHLVDGKFQSDKYPTTPRGKVPLSIEDPTAQDLLWEYAQRRRAVDAEFADDLETALRAVGYDPLHTAATAEPTISPQMLEEALEEAQGGFDPDDSRLSELWKLVEKNRGVR